MKSQFSEYKIQNNSWIPAELQKQNNFLTFTNNTFYHPDNKGVFTEQNF
jgi:hypothetical protein